MADLLVFGHFQYAIYGFVGVAFTHDFWFTMGVTLFLGTVIIYTAFFLELTPTFQYVWAARLPTQLFLGSGAGAAYVHAIGSPRLITTYVLLHGNGPEAQSRFSPLTLLGLLNVLVVFTLFLILAGVFYVVGAYDVPTLGLGIGDGSTIGFSFGFIILGAGLVFLGTWLALMSVFERSGLGATTAKYYIALPFLFLPVAVYDLGALPFKFLDPIISGILAIVLTVLMWLAFYFWAVNVNFKPSMSTSRLRAVDPLYRNPVEMKRFLVVAGVHVALMITGWIIDVSTSGDTRFNVAYYGAIIAGGVVMIASIGIGLSNRAWILDTYATWQERFRVPKAKK